MEAIGGHLRGGYAATHFIFILIITVMIEDINLIGFGVEIEYNKV